jgi:hypothetical protein
MRPCLLCTGDATAVAVAAAAGGQQETPSKEFRLIMANPALSLGAAKAAASAPVAAACRHPITKGVLERFSGDGFHFLGCAAPASSRSAPMSADATLGSQSAFSTSERRPIQR